MSSIVPCTDWLRLYKCLLWNREEEGVEGTADERTDATWSLYSKTESCHTRACAEGCWVFYLLPLHFCKELFKCRRHFCQWNLKSEDLPPTSECLSHHIKRANFQAFVWNRALVPLQNIPSPDEHGWKQENGKLFPVLMTRSPAPEGMTELTTCRCTTSECKRSCSCRKSNLSCTEACLCMADEGCCNPLNEELLSDNDSSASDTEWQLLFFMSVCKLHVLIRSLPLPIQIRTTGR